MSAQKNKILDGAKIEAVIKRLAFQIYESNSANESVVIAGIFKNGALLAHQLCDQLREISNLEVIKVDVKMDKKNPKHSVETNFPIKNFANKSIVIVDDVLNTGSTLIHAVNYFLKIPVKQLQTAVMVNRNHKKYPIKADFKGISLSTTLKEHVHVEIQGVETGVYLT